MDATNNSSVLGQLFTEFNHLSTCRKILLCGTVAITSERVVALLKRCGLPTVTASIMTTGLATMAIMTLLSNAYYTRQRKLPAEKSSLPPVGSLFPSNQTQIKAFIHQELASKKAFFQQWNERREEFAKSHLYEVFSEQPTSWCSDPTIKEKNADWGVTTLLAQAQHEIVPGLWLAGNYLPEVTHGFDANAKAENYELAIAATNRFTDYIRQLPKSCSICQIENAPGAKDVGVGSFSTNDSIPLKAVISSIDNELKQNKKVLVFCQQGADRSATVVIAYLMSIYELSFEDALIYVRSRRFIANPSIEYQEFLKVFETQLAPKFSESKEPQESTNGKEDEGILADNRTIAIRKLGSRFNQPPHGAWGTKENPLGTPDAEGKKKAYSYFIYGLSTSHPVTTIDCYPDTPLKTLRKAIAAEAGVPADRISLTACGRLLKRGSGCDERRTLLDFLGDPSSGGRGATQIHMTLLDQ